jgi:hypothetical protein
MGGGQRSPATGDNVDSDTNSELLDNFTPAISAAQILTAHGIEIISVHLKGDSALIHIAAGASTARRLSNHWTVATHTDERYHLTHSLAGAQVLIILDLTGGVLYRKGDTVDLSAIGGAA